MTDRPSVRSVAIQCNLLSVPSLQKLVREQDILRDSITESITSEP